MRRPDPAAVAARETLIVSEAERLQRGAKTNIQSQQRQVAEAKGQMAAAVCSAKGEMVQAQYQDRSLLGPDAMMTGIHARNVCAQFYQRTGIVPSFCPPARQGSRYADPRRPRPPHPD